MRLRLSLLTIVLAMFAPSVRADIWNATAGTSTIASGSGGELHLYTPASENTLGLGVINGHIIVGASSTFNYRGWLVTAGDALEHYGLPSDEQAGYGVYARGLSAKRKDWFFFVGETAQTYGTSFFSGMRGSSATALLFYDHSVNKQLKLSGRVSVSQKQTGLLGLEYQPRYGVILAGEAGIGNGVFHFGARFDYQNRWLKWETNYANPSSFRRIITPIALTETAGLNSLLNVNLHNFHVGLNHINAQSLINNILTPQTTFNTLYVLESFNRFDLYGSYLEGHSGPYRSVGETAGIAAHFNFISVRGDYFRSAGSRQVVGTFTETLTRHISVSEYISNSAGQTNISFGGSYRNNRFSLQANYATLFTVQPGQSAFARVLSVSVSIRLPHSSTVNTGLIRSKNYRAYGIDGGTYFYSDNPQAEERRGSLNGRYVVAILVTDENGNGISGAHVQVGKDLCVTNHEGSCLLRYKKIRSLDVTVLPDDFQDGSWMVTQTPSTATPVYENNVQPIKIIMKRR